MRPSFLLSELRTGFRRNVTMTVAVVVTVAISLAFFGAALLLGKQIELMKGYWYDKIQVTVTLCADASPPGTCAGGEVTAEQREAVRAQLAGLPQVDEVFYESKEEAFAHYKEQNAGQPISPILGPDAMPESFRVSLINPEEYAAVSEAITGAAGVERVDDQRRLFERLFNLLEGLRDLALALALTQVLAGMLLIMNTVRLAAFARRQETGVMRLVGASNTAIQLPFVLQSAIAGLAGAVLASLLLLVAQWRVVPDQPAQTFSIGGRFIGAGDVWATLPWLFLVGVGVSALASFLTLRRYLKV